MHATSSSSATASRASEPFAGRQPLSSLNNNKFGSNFFNHLHETSDKHDGKASRLFSRNYLRQDFARLYHDVKNGKLAQDEKLKAVRDVFKFLGEGYISHSVEKQAVANLQRLSVALKDDEFKTGNIATINTAVVDFSKFLYEPGKKTPEKISTNTQAFFRSLFELVPHEKAQSAGEHLCKMIDSATALANMEMLLPSDREEAINKFTECAQKFIDSVFADINSGEKFDDAKAIFKDAVYLAVVNAGLLMCYEQKSGLDKLRLLVKRSFVPFAYVCTKAEGIAAGFLTTKVGAAMGTAISGALASTVGKVGIGALAIKFSVPIIFFVGSGALGLAITYGLYKLSEKSSNDLKKSLDEKIKARKNALKSSFRLSNEETEPEITEEESSTLKAAKAKHGDNGALTETEKAHNPTVNQVRTGNRSLADMASRKDASALKSEGFFRKQGRVAKQEYRDMDTEYERWQGVFENPSFLDSYLSQHSNVMPAWMESLRTQTTNLKKAQKIGSKKERAEAVQTALKKFIDDIVNSVGENNQEQKLKVGQLLALFHQYINESDRYTIADFSKRVEDLYKLAGEIAQAAIGDSVPKDTERSTERKDLVAYLQFHIYNAGFAISANHRSLSAKVRRYASIFIAPACNSLLKVETMGVAAVSQMLIEPHITNSILQVGIDSVASVALGVPFVALGIALGAWTLVKADKADAKGIKTLNPMVRDYVKGYLDHRKQELQAELQSEEKGFIEKLISGRELKKVTEMLDQIAVSENLEQDVITLEPAMSV